MPQRTASKCVSASVSAAAEFARWRGQGGNSRASSANTAVWTAAKAGSSSAVARCDITPASRSGPLPPASARPTASASPGAIPQRPMPGVGLDVDVTGDAGRAAAWRSPRSDETTISKPPASASSPGRSGERTTIGTSWPSPSRSSRGFLQGRAADTLGSGRERRARRTRRRRARSRRPSRPPTAGCPRRPRSAAARWRARRRDRSRASSASREQAPERHEQIAGNDRARLGDGKTSRRAVRDRGDAPSPPLERAHARTARPPLPRARRPRPPSPAAGRASRSRAAAHRAPRRACRGPSAALPRPSVRPPRRRSPAVRWPPPSCRARAGARARRRAVSAPSARHGRAASRAARRARTGASASSTSVASTPRTSASTSAAVAGARPRPGPATTARARAASSRTRSASSSPCTISSGA